MDKEGVQNVAEWAANAGLKVLDVPRLTPGVKQAVAEYGLEIGTVDAVRMGELLSQDDQQRSAASEDALFVFTGKIRKY